MGFIIPTAEASVKTLIESIDRVIINPIIFFLFAVAMVYFLYGLAQYLLSPDNEEVRKTSKSHMMWGIVGLFIMVSVFGIMKIILNTLGTKKVQINNIGDFEVSDNKNTPLDEEVKESPGTGQDILTNDIDFGAPKKSSLPAGSSYTKSPFTKNYIPNPLCWRNATDVYAKESTEYKAIESVKKIARNKYLISNGLLLSDSEITQRYPIAYETKTLYDLNNKMYYVWWDARAPVDGGLKGGKDSDCNLVEVQTIQNVGITERSKKPNPLRFNYVSDDKYIRIIDSGVGGTLTEARSKAIMNALVEIGKLKGKPLLVEGSSLDPIIDFPYQVLPEEKYYDAESTSGSNIYEGYFNASRYDYWVVVEAPR